MVLPEYDAGPRHVSSLHLRFPAVILRGSTAGRALAASPLHLTTLTDVRSHPERRPIRPERRHSTAPTRKRWKPEVRRGGLHASRGVGDGSPDKGQRSVSADARAMDERRLGLVVRALRRRREWRQVDLALAAAVSQSTVSNIERGHLDSLSLRVVKAVIGALDGRLVSEVRWRGGQIDRLLDERHASLASEVVRILVDAGWEVRVEVSYARFGERGSIDILAWHAASRTLLIVEVKSELTSIEATLRKLDEKERLAAVVASERFGWRPDHIGVMLIVREGPTDRARARRAGALLAAALPSRSVAARSWLRRPTGGIRSLWFLSPTAGGGTKRRTGGPYRIRRSPRASAKRESQPRTVIPVPRVGRPFV